MPGATSRTMLWGAPGRSTSTRRGRLGHGVRLRRRRRRPRLPGGQQALQLRLQRRLVEVAGDDQRRVVGPVVGGVKGAHVVERDRVDGPLQPVDRHARTDDRRRTASDPRRRSRPPRADRGAARRRCAGRCGRAASPPPRAAGASGCRRRSPSPPGRSRAAPASTAASRRVRSPATGRRPSCSSSAAMPSASRAPAPSSSISAAIDASPASAGGSQAPPLRNMNAADTIGATSRRRATTSSPLESEKRVTRGRATAGSGPTAGACAIDAGVSIKRSPVRLHVRGAAGSGVMRRSRWRAAATRAKASRTDSVVVCS